MGLFGVSDATDIALSDIGILRQIYKRRLFIGVPIETVNKILGHIKISTIQTDAKVVERKLKENRKCLNKIILTQQKANPKLNSR